MGTTTDTKMVTTMGTPKYITTAINMDTTTVTSLAIITGTTTDTATGNGLTDLELTVLGVQVNLHRKHYSDENRVAAIELIQNKYDVSHPKKSFRNHRRLFFQQSDKSKTILFFQRGKDRPSLVPRTAQQLFFQPEQLIVFC